MKKAAILMFAFIFALSIAAMAIAADKTVKGTIRGVNVKAGKITFCPEGSTKNEVFKVQKHVNLKAVKANEKAELVLTPKNEVKEIKAVTEAAPAAPAAKPAPKKRKMIEGC